jgi:transaldolase/glucose-6-phosphate isomerase
MNSVIKLGQLGQSIWYDNLQRSLIQDGTLKNRIEKREILGVTSNPSIFEKAISSSKDYHDDLQTMSWAGLSAEEMFYRLAIKDIQDLADLFMPYFESTGGKDGFVSLEVNPKLAYDTQRTIDEALWLWETVDRPNLLVKIPATKEGLPAITEVIAAGVNVNVTLIFSRKRYIEVMDAYLQGLAKRLEAGEDISHIASVGSFFVSRLENKADGRLQKIIDQGGENAEKAKSLLGKIAVENTRLAYQDYEAFFSSDRFKKLAEAGAMKQRPLWASTSTKNPNYSDIKYVESLVAENSVNTVPPETLDAFIDHGDPEITIYDDLDQAEKDFKALAELGISIDEITKELEDEGVQKFAESFNKLLAVIEDQKNKFRKNLGSLAEKIPTEVEAFKSYDVIGRMHRTDPTIWTEEPDGQMTVQTRLGWLGLPDEGLALTDSLNKLLKDCRSEGYEKVLLLGMGGSSLAPETISLVLGDKISGLTLEILDSTIPAQVREAEAWVDYEKTVFIVASKSGTTTETLSLYQYFWEKSEAVLGDRRPLHFIAITDPGSKLAKMGQSSGFRAVFTANPNVGGRYSALSHFGLVPAALMGVDLERFLCQAHEMTKNFSATNPVELNLGALLGIVVGLGDSSGKDKLTILADERLKPVGAWLEQLVAESSGKQGRGIVPVNEESLLAPENYRMDRLFVYLRETGEHDDFVGALENRGHTVVSLDVTDPYELAAQFYLWEIVIAVACGIIGVNAFDQPDVQDNKNRTKEKISRYQETGVLEEPEAIWERGGTKVFGVDFDGLSTCESVGDVIEKFIKLSKDGDYIALNAYLPRNKKTKEKLQTLRKYILQESGRATTLGFGPRFLHSTGQLHKGGANNGVFIQITQDDPSDLPIPGLDYSFGVLARAQALGDLEALLARDRRAIRIHLGPEDMIEV